MARMPVWRVAGVQLTTVLVAVGLVAVVAGATLAATAVDAPTSAAATTTLKLTTSAAGATCDNSNPSAPVCSGLANGDVVDVSGTGFHPGALASIEQCNSDPAQPVILFLGNDVPVSCSELNIVTVPSSGPTKGDLSGSKTVATGTVGPPITTTPDTCTQTTPSTSVITGCSATGNNAADAAQYPCPPTASQQAAGDTCVLAIGDQDGDRAIGTILFGTETLPTSSVPTSSGPTSTSATSSTSTSSTSSSTTSTSPTSTSTTTQVSAGSIALGPSGTVTDNVTVGGTTAHGSPTGTVTFYVCRTGTGTTLADGPCAATAADQLSIVRLAAGPSNTSGASSGTFEPGSVGTWCFSAVYGGSSIYTGSQDDTSSADLDPNECVLVGPAGSTSTSNVSVAQITIGANGSVTDAVQVSGNSVGGAPTGSVDFYVCQTGTTQTLVTGVCPATGTPEDASVGLVPGAGDASFATSSAFAPASAGTWCFSAAYGGSTTYLASGDNTSSSTLDADECVLVAPAPPPPGDHITSANHDTVVAGATFTFPVTTSGSPTPLIKKKGHLPGHCHFTNNHDGTATLAGTPRLKKGPGVYHFLILARFGPPKGGVVVTQAFTLTVLP